MKAILKGSLILTITNLMVRAASHLYRVLMGRMLPIHEFGLLNLALPIQYMVVLLTSSGIAPTIAKFVSEATAREDDQEMALIVSSSAFYFTLLGALAGILVYLAAPLIGEFIFHDPRTVLPIKVSAAAVPFGILVSVYTGVLQGHKRFEEMGAILALMQVMRIAFAAVLVVLGYKAMGAILGSTMGFIAAVPVAYIMFSRMGVGSASPDPKVFKKVLIFAIPISATAIATFVLAYIDIIIIGFYHTPARVGIYSAASPTSRLVLAFSTALYATVLPSISELKAMDKAQEIKNHIWYSYKMSLGVLVPTTVLSIYFAGPIITLLFGNTYAEAAGPFSILVVGTAFFGIFTLNSGIFQGLGRPGIPMKILLFTAGMDIMLNLVMVPNFEIIGAALASSMSFIFAGLVSTIALWWATR